MASDEKLYTLTALAKMAGVSMPTLQRYKKLYQDRIPSVGEGRKQRYPKEAVQVVAEIKAENLKNRGRRAGGSKAVAKRKRKPAAKKRAAKKRTAKKRTAKKRPAKKRTARKRAAAQRQGKGGEMLSLAEIGRRTGISYPTLISYVKKYGAEIPHQGSGRKRRFPEEAVPVFEELRARSGRRRGRGARKAVVGGRTATVSDAALARRVRQLERAQRELTRQLDSVIKLLKKPMKITIGPR